MIARRDMPSGPVDETGRPEQDDPWERIEYEQTTRDRRNVEAHLQYRFEKETAFRGNRA